MYPVALTIAGSDPSGGAGLQADLKTFHQHNVYGMSVVTLLTVQNTQEVSHVETLSPQLVLKQLDAVLGDIPPAAAKTGALGSVDIVNAIAERAGKFRFPLVVDPVMISKHGTPLMDESAADEMIRKLLPHAFLVTPNLPEANQLTGESVNSLESMAVAARKISELGPKNVLVKGGHLDGEAIDVLWADGEISYFRSPRLATDHTHGTGCVTSAAITARLALGAEITSAVSAAKEFITRAIESNPGLGHGYGPVNMLAEP